MANMPAPCKARRSVRSDTEEEMRLIWAAADQLDKEGDYLKLIILTVLRRDELAEARWSEFDNTDAPTIFKVSTERTKLKAAAKADKKRVYTVPLVPLAQRILRGVKRDGDLVFPGLDAEGVKAKLLTLDQGAPADFKLHTFRHTCATFLENKGRSEWERGLVLNHAGSGGSTTSGDPHGYPVELKRSLLLEWADYVESVTTPVGAARLR